MSQDSGAKHFQHGSYDLTKVRDAEVWRTDQGGKIEEARMDSERGYRKLKCTVKFTESMAERPLVTVALAGFSVHSNHLDIDLKVTETCLKTFTFHIVLSDKSKIDRIRVSYTAFTKSSFC